MWLMDRGKGNNLLWVIGRNASEYDSEGQIMMIMMTTIMMTKKSRGEGGGEGDGWISFTRVCVCVLELHVISIETLCSNCLIWLFLEQCDVRISVPYSLIKPKGFYNPTNERIKSIASNYLLTWKYSKN